MGEPFGSEPATRRGSLLGRMALVLNAGLAIALAVIWIGMAARGEFWGADFTGFYTGWAMVLDDQGDRLYDLNLQIAYQQRIAPELAATGGRLLFNYPPHVAVPAAVLAFLPCCAAFYAWSLIQLALLIPLARFLHQLTPDRSPRAFLLVLVTVAAFPPLFMSFQMGQVSLLILVCLLGFVCNLERNNFFWTAFWLALLTIKPQFLLAPTAILFAGRRWREMGVAAFLFASWALLASSVLGWSRWIEFATVIRHLAWQFGSDGIYPLAMYNFKGFLTSALGGERVALVNFLSAAAVPFVLSVMLAMWRKPARTASPEWDLRLSLTLFLALLVNPHFNPADAVTLITPAILFYRGLKRSGQSARAVAIILVCGPLLFALDCYGRMATRPMAIHPFFLLMVALTGAVAVAVVRVRAEAPQAA
ncbi:MAG TPA: glycosyltransferase family 87 protein [Gemmataceae bacterium]|nr:glycosyltransferase family 87 protein [Gemmataceae bacterium]